MALKWQLHLSVKTQCSHTTKRTSCKWLTWQNCMFQRKEFLESNRKKIIIMSSMWCNVIKSAVSAEVMLTRRFVRFAGFSTFYRLGYRKRLWLWFGLCCCFELIWIDVLISWRHGFHRNWEGFLLIRRARDALWPRGRAENTHRNGLLTALGHRNSLGSRNLHNMNITRVSKTDTCTEKLVTVIITL